MTDKQYALLALVGGIVAAIGSLLPWATIRSGFGSIDITGTNGDGVITLALGVIVAGLGFARFGGQSTGIVRNAASLLGLAIALVGVYDYTNLASRIGEIQSDYVSGVAGVGLYVVIVGGFIAFVSGPRGKTEAPSAPPPAAPPPAQPPPPAG